MKSLVSKHQGRINRSRTLNNLTLFWAALALFGGSAVTSLASDPVGIYAFVDKVVLEPSQGAPERIQVWGGFALAEGSGEKYSPAQRGYMYFKLKPGKETICQNEWNDLKSVAGTNKIVTFGTRYGEKGTVRKPDAKPENPDVYPTGWGMTKNSRADYGPVKDLLALREAKPKDK
jgi:hypothetical protein